jgi:hypothetical protein
MSQKNIRKAFQNKLTSMPLGLGSSKTAFENVTYAPKVGEAYQRTVLAPITPENPTLGDGYFREVGFYQVVLSYPKGEGAGRISDMAELVQDYFKRGTTLVEGSDKIIVDRTPQISPIYINDNRAEITIRIRYYSEQFV